VRQALRLIPNRKQMNDQVFLGYGTVGNDVANPQDPAYPSLPQREQDIEQAKSLLRSAGHPNLNVSVVFTNFAAGEVQQAELYATQAKAAGVNVNLVNQPTAQFFANSYAKVPFGMSWWNATTYLTFASLALAPGAPYPEVHQNSSYYNKVYKQALSTVDEAQRRALTAELMRFEYDQGGYHIPLFFPNIEAMASSVNGVTKNITGFPVNGSQGWQHIWLKD
jgi:peptide/nickel transport system substrate-binding protein